jgi:SAM-dependent methyltransferase
MRGKIINFIDKCVEAKISIKNIFKNIGKPPSKHIKLHLGCGGIHLPDFINIDIKKSAATDVVMNVMDIKYPKESVDRIESYHLVEHLEPREFNLALKEWYRVLKKDGVLVIECPDLEELCKRFLRETEEWKWRTGLMIFYGFPDTEVETGQQHKNGFSKRRLAELLKKTGFKRVVAKKPYQDPEMPFLRIEATK